MTAASGKADGGADALLREWLAAEWMVTHDWGGDRQSLIDRTEAHLATPAANGPGEADGWLPIESAPKDGTYVLAYCGDDFQSVCYWSTSIWVNGGAWIYDECRSDTVQLEPTHWRPLPAPPGASASTPQPGMVTVPREATDEMIGAAIKATGEQLPFWTYWEVMINAALRDRT